MAIGADPDAARTALAREIADYWQYYQAHFCGQVPASSAERANAAYEAGGAERLAGELDDEILMALGWYGTLDDDLAAAVDSYRAAGLDRFIAYHVPVGDDPAASVRNLLDAIRYFGS